MSSQRYSFLTCLLTVLFPFTVGAQLSLSGTSYLADFNSLNSGLPTGWSVSTGATVSTLGTATTFTTAPTAWNATAGVFRNSASNSAQVSDNATAQSNRTDRALGWRPVGVTGLDTGAREGAVTLTIANTTGLQNFNLSVTLFTANNVANDQTYALEYRVGPNGSFTSLGTYLTGAPFNSSTLSANSLTLSALNNQSDSVLIRIRGISTTGTGSLDTLGIDNFTLTYAAVPEPSTYAAILGALALVGAGLHRRLAREKARIP
jgi:hypothetical protein